MSLTLVTSPDAKHAAFNSVEYSVSSDNSAQTNFQISCEIKEGTNTIATLFSRYASGATVATFNISSVLSEEILSNSDGHDVVALGSSFGVYSTSTQNGVLNYTLTFTEWYDVSGVLTSDATLDVTTIGGASIYAYIMALQENVFSPQSFTDYVDGAWLTNGIHYLKSEEEIDITFLTDEASLKLQRKEYTAGVLTGTTTTAATTINNGRGIAHTAMVGDYIELTLLDSLDVVISETITIYADGVGLSDNLRIEFKNRLGGMDAYTFRKATSDINTNQELININDIWKALTISPESTVTLEGKEEDYDVMEWLGEMHTSRVIYLTDNSNRLRVATISRGDTMRSRDPQKPVIKIRLSDPILN